MGKEQVKFDDKVKEVAEQINEEFIELKKENYSVNSSPTLAIERLDRLENDISFNREVVKYWLDNLNFDKDTKLFKNYEDNLELAYVVVDYYELKEKDYKEKKNDKYILQIKKLNKIVKEKLNIELHNKKKMFKVFGWENMRKASKIVNLHQKFIFSRLAKEIDFSRKIEVRKVPMDSIVITKKLDGEDNDFNFEDYNIFLLQDLKNLEEIIRKPVSKLAYGTCKEREIQRYVDYSVLVIIIYIDLYLYKIEKMKEPEKIKEIRILKVFILNYFEINITDGGESFLEFLKNIQTSYKVNQIISEKYPEKYNILKLILDELVSCYEDDRKKEQIIELWYSPKKIAEYLKITEDESRQANLVILKHAVYERNKKNSKSTAYRRLLGVEKRSEWVKKNKNYRISQGEKIFKEINFKNIKIRKLEDDIIKHNNLILVEENRADLKELEKELKKLKVELRKVKKEVKNNTLIELSQKENRVLYTNSEIEVFSRVYLAKELDEFYFSEYRTVLNSLKKENKDKKLGKLDEDILNKSIEVASYNLFLKKEKLKKVIDKQS